ncbi:MAG: hypothetical protein II882_02645 [Lachnospiraceae bacterium]|nr:hypothetical protein [Lachnospiraceae bacterium]
MNTQTAPVQASAPGEDELLKGTDGVYRWVHELNLYTNPAVLFVIWKIFLLIGAGEWVLSNLLNMNARDYWWEGFKSNAAFHLQFMLAFLALCTLGYYIYALIMGGKYCVLFEMDEQGVRHTQLPRQVKKAEALGALTVLAGLAGGSLATVGIGLNSASRSSMYSEFSRVKSIRASRWMKLIKVNEPFNKNQVYIGGTDYDFVRRYIIERCPQAKLRG